MAMATDTQERKPTGDGTAEPRAVKDQVEVRNPADNSIAGHVPNMSADDVKALAAKLREAQPAWEALGPDGRAKHLYNWLDWVMDNEKRLLELVQREGGKSWGDASIETMLVVEVINYYAKNAKKFLADEVPHPHGPATVAKKLKLMHRPYQLVGVIEPWNYPLGMPFMDVPPALMAGAAVLSKPSEVVPLAWSEAVRGWNEEIGAPPVLGCATGFGETGAAVVDEVDMIQFTGSVDTGRKIAVRAGERLIPASLELGGKDAMVVLDDADLHRTVGGAVWGGLFNAGQSCVAVERVYVQEGVYDEFVSKLTDEVRKLRVGQDKPGEMKADIGAMATESQLELVERQVKDAVDKGARVLTGGKRADRGLFYPPTVLVDVDHTMACMREETFGPTIPIMKVSSEDEAIRLANDSPYGLSGSVWTSDPERAERVARQLETGGVNVNDVMMNLFQFPLPFGGWKDSGIGYRFGGRGGMLKFCRQQAYVSERVKMKRELHWYPYGRGKAKLTAVMVRMLGMHDWRRRLGRKPKQR